MQRNTNLIIVDIENCLIHPNPDQAPFHEHLLTSNLAFFKAESDRINTGNYQRVVLAETKPSSTFKHAKFTLPVLQHYFENILPTKVNVVFDPFWSIENNTATTFADAAFPIEENLTIEERDAARVFSNIIAAIHRTAIQYHNDDNAITVHVYTANEKINTMMDALLEKHHDLLPNTVCEFNLCCYTENVIDESTTIIRGTANPNLKYETAEKFTTALEWQKNHPCPASLFVGKEKTLQLLSPNQPKITIATTPNPNVIDPATSITATEKPKLIVDKNDLIHQDETLLRKYMNSEIDITQYLDLLLPIYHREKLEPTDAELMNSLVNIANLPVWDSKGKSFWNRSAPGGITELRNWKSSSFSELATKIKPKLEDKFTSVARSHTTTDFYQLIAALGNPKMSNLTREAGIKAFCSKHEKQGVHYHQVSRQPSSARVSI